MDQYCRMIPLVRTSIINSNGETVDDELELQNFKKASEVLADVWTDHVIDNHPVTAVASFDQNNAYEISPSEVWIRDHVCTMHVAIYVANTEVL